jgi:DNA-binding Lrp family transcriptional regulator
MYIYKPKGGLFMDQLIKLLKNNARITNSELAVLLDKTEEQVAADIAKLEADGVIGLFRNR